MNKTLPFVVLLLAFLGLVGYLGYDVYRSSKGPEAPTDPDVAKLVNDLGSWDAKLRIPAVERLGEMGSKAKEAVPHLVHALKTGDEELRINGTLALGQIGKPAVPELLKAMKDGNPEVRYHAVWAIGLIGPDAAEPAGAAVVRAMEDSDDDIRRKAVESVGRMSPAIEGAVPALAKALKDKSATVQEAAVDALGQYGPAGAKELLNSLALRPENRTRAIQALGKMHDEAGEVAPALVAVLKEPAQGKDNLHGYASQALVGLGRGAVPALVAGLDDPDPNTRAQCLQVLIQLGTEGVVPLADALKSPHVDVRRFAAGHLANLNVSDKLIPLALGAALKDKDRTVRLAAAASLRNLGPGARPALSAIEEAAQGQDQELKDAVRPLLQTIRGR